MDYNSQKMIFIMNALNDGWCVRKVNDSFIFVKKHENKREVFSDSYLEKFVKRCKENTTPNSYDTIYL